MPPATPIARTDMRDIRPSVERSATMSSRSAFAVLRVGGASVVLRPARNA